MTKHTTFESYYVAGQGVVTVKVNGKPKYIARATNDFQGGWFLFDAKTNKPSGRFASLLKIDAWVQEQE